MSYNSNLITGIQSNSQNFAPVVEEKEQTEDLQAKPKVKSLSRSFFKTQETQKDSVEAALLIDGFKNKEIDHKKEFKFGLQISIINEDNSIQDKDQELAKRFKKLVNPGNIPDGHCASCAFCSHLHFVGHPLEEAKAPENYKQFGDWFYKTFSTRFDDNAIDSERNETYGAFKDRIETAIKECTSAGESLLISISDGAHWYNAYNDGKRVWFIDSQSGKGFNLYEDQEFTLDQIVSYPETVNLIKVTKADVLAYQKMFSS